MLNYSANLFIGLRPLNEQAGCPEFSLAFIIVVFVVVVIVIIIIIIIIITLFPKMFEPMSELHPCCHQTASQHY